MGGPGAELLRLKHGSCFESLEGKPSVPVEFIGKKPQRNKRLSATVLFGCFVEAPDDGI